jgi:hypothetical protein
LTEGNEHAVLDGVDVFGPAVLTALNFALGGISCFV